MSGVYGRKWPKKEEKHRSIKDEWVALSGRATFALGGSFKPLLTENYIVFILFLHD